MKKTYIKLLLRGVRQTRARFLSILAIAALGAGFLAGLMSTTPDMQESVDRYYDAHSFFDLDIKGTLGMTPEDAAALETLDSVDRVMAACVTDLELITAGGTGQVARIYGMPLKETGSQTLINDFILLEGRLPERADECLMMAPNGFIGSCSTGTVYTISPSNKDYDKLGDTYAFTELTVVGIVQTPHYMSMEAEPSTVGSGQVDLVLYVLPEAYALEIYTDIFLTLTDARALNAFSEDYTELVDAESEKLEDFGLERSILRTEEVRSEAQAELDEARLEYEDAKAEAEQELADARQELDEGWQEYYDGLSQLEEAEQEIADARTEIDNAVNTLLTQVEEQKTGLYSRIQAAAQPQYDAALAELEAQEAAAQQQLDSAQAQIDAQQAQIDALRQQLEQAEAAGFPVSEEDKAALAAGQAQLDNAQAQLDAQRQAMEAQFSEARATLDETFQTEINNQYYAALAQIDAAAAAGWTEIGSGQAELAEAEQELADGRQELDDALIELNDGETEYSDGKAEAEAELADAQREIDDAQAEIDDIADAEWYLTTREDTVSYAHYKSDSEKVAAIARVFPVFFFLVAALVALTTMTRMVEEERTQIGTLKALGYSNSVIMLYYLGYSALATLLGSVLGMIIGFRLLPLIISNAYSMMYSLPKMHTPFRWDYALLITLISVVCIMAATLAACLNQLREKPSTLMLPRAPKAGKRVFLERIGFIWKRLSFTRKVTVRNIFRYKKRLFMTVIGIAGCCGLLVAGFGLRDSIHDIVDLQFGQIYQYNLSIYLKNEAAAREDPHISSFLQDEALVESSALIHSESVHVETAEGSQQVTLYAVKQPEDLTAQVLLRDRLSGSPVPFEEDSLVLTEKLCETLDIRIGDTVTLKTTEGKTVRGTVSGIAENYVSGHVFLCGGLYESLFGETPEYNLALVQIHDESQENRDSISQQVLKSDEVLLLQFSRNIRDSFAKTVRSIDYIVIVLIVAAGLLAVIVLYNLTNINICERKKELATIKVLGFHQGEVAAYIYRETTVLCLFGIALGFLLGIWLHGFVVQTAEVSSVMFGREIYPMSYVFSALVTLVFTALVDVLMLGKLRAIDMVESMKANE